MFEGQLREILPELDSLAAGGGRANAHQKGGIFGEPFFPDFDPIIWVLTTEDSVGDSHDGVLVALHIRAFLVKFGQRRNFIGWVLVRGLWRLLGTRLRRGGFRCWGLHRGPCSKALLQLLVLLLQLVQGSLGLVRFLLVLGFLLLQLLQPGLEIVPCLAVLCTLGSLIFLPLLRCVVFFDLALSSEALFQRRFFFLALLCRIPIVAALFALVLDLPITLRAKVLLLRFHPSFAFLLLIVFTRQLGIRHLVVALDGPGRREIGFGYLHKPQKGFLVIGDEFRIRSGGCHAGQTA